MAFALLSPNVPTALPVATLAMRRPMSVRVVMPIAMPTVMECGRSSD